MSLDRPDDAEMTLVYLETGPNSASHTAERKQEIFRGHMENIQRLGDDGRLLIAGPFGDPRHPLWRGILLLDVADLEQAKAVGDDDPGVTSGEFRMSMRPITASRSLRDCRRLELEMRDELQAAGQAERQPGGPPPGLRRYAMMHAEDVARAWNALNRAGTPRVIWWARFRDGSDGVLVLDAPDVPTAEAALAGIDVGPAGLDRWMSTQALERLPEAARV